MTNSKHIKGRWWRIVATVGLLFFSIVLIYLRIVSLSDDSLLTPSGTDAAHWVVWPDQSGEVSVADSFRLRGNLAAAQAYEQTEAVSATDVELLRQLAIDYAEQGYWHGAQQNWILILQVYPQDPQALYELGLQRLPFDTREAYGLFERVPDDSDYADMSQQLQALVAAVELETPAYQMFRIGQALAALERWDQAEQAFDLATALDPASAEAWAYLGFVRAQSRRGSAAAIERGLVLGPESALVWLMAGLTWETEGDLENALQAVLMAQELEPLNPAIAIELGHIYRQTGDLVSAEYWLQAGVSLAGEDDGRFVQSLAMFYAEEAYDLDGAGLATLRAAVDRWPQNADLLTAYGWALFNAGDPAAALDQINAARLLAPNEPRAMYYEGLILMQAGEEALAAGVFESILALDEPEEFDTLARRALAELE